MTDTRTRTKSELERLFREHAAGLAGAARGVLGRSEDVAEIMQEAFLKAWSALRSGADPRDRTAWVFVLLLNTARDRRRTLERRPSALGLDEVNPLDLTTRAESPVRCIERREAMEAARREIHRLRAEERDVFLLRTSAGLSFEAVAGALSIPVGTAKTRMRQALSRLRERLAPFGPAHEVGDTAGRTPGETGGGIETETTR